MSWWMGRANGGAPVTPARRRPSRRGSSSDIAGVVLRVPTDRVVTVVSRDAKKIAQCTAWWHADGDAPMTDSERHGFLRRQRVFGERMTTEERYSMLEEWANDADVKIGITAGF